MNEHSQSVPHGHCAEVVVDAVALLGSHGEPLDGCASIQQEVLLLSDCKDVVRSSPNCSKEQGHIELAIGLEEQLIVVHEIVYEIVQGKLDLLRPDLPDRRCN